MSIWLRNLIGILFILHGLVYGMMLIPFPDMPGSGMGKYWSGFVGSKVLGSLNVSDYKIKLIAIIISLIALACFIIAGSTILSTGIPTKFILVISLFSASISVIFLIFYWHTYNIVGFLINVAVLVLIPYLYIKLQ